MNELAELAPTLNATFVWEPLPDGCILYCQESGRILTLNPTAELILSYCDGATTLSEIFTLLAEETALGPDAFWSAVKQCLEEQVLVNLESGVESHQS
jgi:hypothetical protein